MWAPQLTTCKAAGKIGCRVNRLGALLSRQYSARPATADEAPARKKVTLNTVRRLYEKGTPISMLTAYDYPTGLVVDRSGADTCLVGDSLGMVALGYDSTVPVTMQEMVHHCRATRRGCTQALLIGDLPFGTYQESAAQAIRSGFRMMQEGRAETVKLEGGRELADTVRRMVAAGIPVLGHVGLRPQQLSVHGGFRVQGKSAAQAVAILEDALALQEAGCWGVVIECVPDEVASAITERLEIPTIGIGAGPRCSGQVLVYSDVLGTFDKFSPRFCKRYASLTEPITAALAEFHVETRSGAFPAPEHSFPMKEEERERLVEALHRFDVHRGHAQPAPVTRAPIKVARHG